MRMWMVNPRIMCGQHLLGEHNEIHMFIGHIKRKRRFHKFITKGLIEPKSIKTRHDELVREMKRRGYRHKTPVHAEDVRKYLSFYSKPILEVEINKDKSFSDLMERCSRCEERWEENEN